MEFVILVPIIAAILVLVAVGVIGWYFYMKIRFKTVSSNEAGIVTGTNLGEPSDENNVIKDANGRYMKIIRGGGHRLKMFQSFDRISLKSFQLTLKTPETPTKEGVGIYAVATATIKIADTKEGVAAYAEQFLGKKPSEIHAEVGEVLGGNLRAILSSMSVEDIINNREEFNSKVRDVAQDQLTKMGFHITSLTLNDLKDDNGYLENLGKPKIAEVQRIADIAKLENERKTALKEAEADEEISKERLLRETNIAEAQKDKDLNDARILAETEKERAIAEAAYDLEQEERRLNIEKQRLEIREQEKVKELKLKEMERENEVRLQERQVELEKQEVEVRKQRADAEYYAKTRHAEAEAEAQKLAGNAEAEVIRNRSAAEVEALEKRAEAMNKHKEVMLTEKVIEMIPKYAEAVSQSMANVESIKILDGGSGDQLKSMPNAVTSMMANMSEGLGQMTGINLNEVVENFAKPSQHQNNFNIAAKDGNAEVEVTTED